MKKRARKVIIQEILDKSCGDHKDVDKGIFIPPFGIYKKICLVNLNTIPERELLAIHESYNR